MARAEQSRVEQGGRGVGTETIRDGSVTYQGRTGSREDQGRTGSWDGSKTDRGRSGGEWRRTEQVPINKSHHTTEPNKNQPEGKNHECQLR
jgi:hypothetical protein